MVRAATVSTAHVHLHYSARKFRNALLAGISGTHSGSELDTHQANPGGKSKDKFVGKNDFMKTSNGESTEPLIRVESDLLRHSNESLSLESMKNGRNSPKLEKRMSNGANSSKGGNTITVKTVSNGNSSEPEQPNSSEKGNKRRRKIKRNEKTKENESLRPSSVYIDPKTHLNTDCRSTQSIQSKGNKISEENHELPQKCSQLIKINSNQEAAHFDPSITFESDELICSTSNNLLRSGMILSHSSGELSCSLNSSTDNDFTVITKRKSRHKKRNSLNLSTSDTNLNLNNDCYNKEDKNNLSCIEGNLISNAPCSSNNKSKCVGGATDKRSFSKALQKDRKSDNMALKKSNIPQLCTKHNYNNTHHSKRRNEFLQNGNTSQATSLHKSEFQESELKKEMNFNDSKINNLSDNGKKLCSEEMAFRSKKVKAKMPELGSNKIFESNKKIPEGSIHAKKRKLFKTECEAEIRSQAAGREIVAEENVFPIFSDENNEKSSEETRQHHHDVNHRSMQSENNLNFPHKVKKSRSADGSCLPKKVSTAPIQSDLSVSNISTQNESTRTLQSPKNYDFKTKNNLISTTDSESDRRNNTFSKINDNIKSVDKGKITRPERKSSNQSKNSKITSNIPVVSKSNSKKTESRSGDSKTFSAMKNSKKSSKNVEDGSENNFRGLTNVSPVFCSDASEVENLKDQPVHNPNLSVSYNLETSEQSTNYENNFLIVNVENSSRSRQTNTKKSSKESKIPLKLNELEKDLKSNKGKLCVSKNTKNEHEIEEDFKHIQSDDANLDAPRVIKNEHELIKVSKSKSKRKKSSNARNDAIIGQESKTCLKQQVVKSEAGCIGLPETSIYCSEYQPSSFKEVNKVKTELLRAEDIDDIVKESFNSVDSVSVDDNFKAFLNIQKHFTKNYCNSEKIEKTTENLINQENERSSPTNSKTAQPSEYCKKGDSEKNTTNEHCENVFFTTPLVEKTKEPLSVEEKKGKSKEPSRCLYFDSPDEILLRDKVKKKPETLSNFQSDNFEEDSSDCIREEMIVLHHTAPKSTAESYFIPTHLRQNYGSLLEVINEESGELSETPTQHSMEMRPGNSYKTNEINKSQGTSPTHALQCYKVNYFHVNPVKHVQVVNLNKMHEIPFMDDMDYDETVLSRECSSNHKSSPVSFEHTDAFVDVVKTVHLSNSEVTTVMIDSDSDVMTASSVADEECPQVLSSAHHREGSGESEKVNDDRHIDSIQKNTTPRDTVIEEISSSVLNCNSPDTRDARGYSKSQFFSGTKEDNIVISFNGSVTQVPNYTPNSFNMCENDKKCHDYNAKNIDDESAFSNDNRESLTPLLERTEINEKTILDNSNDNLSSTNNYNDEENKIETFDTDDDNEQDRKMNVSCSSDGSEASVLLDSFDKYSFQCVERLEQVKDVEIIYDNSGDEVDLLMENTSNYNEERNERLNCKSDDSFRTQSRLKLEFLDILSKPPEAVKNSLENKCARLPKVNTQTNNLNLCKELNKNLRESMNEAKFKDHENILEVEYNVSQAKLESDNLTNINQEFLENDKLPLLSSFPNGNQQVETTKSLENKSGSFAENNISFKLNDGKETEISFYKNYLTPDESTCFISSPEIFNDGEAQKACDLTSTRRNSEKNISSFESIEENLCSESAVNFASASLIPLHHSSVDNLKSELSDIGRQESSSSNTTTLSTVRQNSNDSIFLSDSEFLVEVKDTNLDTLNKIKTLKELCLITVLSLPNSLNVLESLGLSDLLFDNVDSTEKSSSRLEEGTFLSNESLSTSHNLLINASVKLQTDEEYESVEETDYQEINDEGNISSNSSNILSDRYSVNQNPNPCKNVCLRKQVYSEDCGWVGLPTTDDSTILLSPSQYKNYKFPPSPEQTSNLLDLHKKFSARRGYYESNSCTKGANPNVATYRPHQEAQIVNIEPVMLRSEHTNPEKDYTKEILEEAANLLAVNIYRKIRNLSLENDKIGRSSSSGLQNSVEFKATSGSENFNCVDLHATSSPESDLLKSEQSNKVQTSILFYPEIENSAIPKSRYPKGVPAPDVPVRKEVEKKYSSVGKGIVKYNLKSNFSHVPRISETSNYFQNENLHCMNERKTNETCNYSKGRSHNVSSEERCLWSREGDERKKTKGNNPSDIESSYSRLVAIIQENADLCRNESAMDFTRDNGVSWTDTIDSNAATPASSVIGSRVFEYGGSSVQSESETFYNPQYKDLPLTTSQAGSKIKPKMVQATVDTDTVSFRSCFENRNRPNVLPAKKFSDILAKNEEVCGFKDDKVICENVVINYDNNSCTSQTVNNDSQNSFDVKNRREVKNDQISASVSLTNGKNELDANVPVSEQNQKSIAESRLFFENLNKIKSNLWNNYRRSSLPNVNEVKNENKYKISKKGDFTEISKSQTIFNKTHEYKNTSKLETKNSNADNIRDQMYCEYMRKLAERSERRNKKVIKISQPQVEVENLETSNNWSESKNDLGSEFICKVRQRMEKYGIDLNQNVENQLPDEIPRNILNAPTNPSENSTQNLPKHLQEFLQLSGCESTVSQSKKSTNGVWSPATTPEAKRKVYEEPPKQEERKARNGSTEPIPPVWTPRSAGASPERVTYRPIKFQSPTLPRKTVKENEEGVKSPSKLPLPTTDFARKTNGVNSSSRERVSSFSPVSGKKKDELKQSESGTLSVSHAHSPTLPKSQNPTITLLQKAREGQIAKGAQYLNDQKMYTKEISEKSKGEECDKNLKGGGEITKTNSSQKQLEEVEAAIKNGIPTEENSESKEINQQKWYKRMYESLHRANQDKSFVTIRYKPNYRVDSNVHIVNNGYTSEPEVRNSNESEQIGGKYATLDRRRTRMKENNSSYSSIPTSKPSDEALKQAVNIYNSQPGRIENYEPGHSSIAEKETREWWDEMMEIFDKQCIQTDQRNHCVNPPATQKTPFMTYALKDGGYESDSTLVFKRRDEKSQMSPTEQKMAYKVIQKGGEVPLHGLRKPAPERPKEPVLREVPAPPSSSLGYQPSESPAGRYAESAVTLQYRRPVLAEVKEALSEDELARRQAEAMRRLYQEERRRKYLQELHDISSRRHTDHFTPSQKSPIPLNRYDDFYLDESPSRSRQRDRTPEPKLVARALFNFVGQSSRELSFRRGDIIFVRRQIDKNWYEGEHNAMIGLFPFNYVEIIPYDNIRTTPKKPTEGQARAKFNFVAQTHLELSLVKGELVVLTRRVDNNWFEGRIGNRRGIFPVSYVEVLVEPGERAVSPTRPTTPANKPVVVPASHSVITNGSHQPTSNYSPLPSDSYKGEKQDPSPVSQTLHVDTQSDPIPYRALYNYQPQNEDELELHEGDMVYVIEKCDDGWYVGSSQRTGAFGTFPGNYVQRVA